MVTVFTIGHSTRTLEELIEALKAHSIEVLFDIRAYPASRRMPWFARESLEQELPRSGVQYIWKKEMGGRRGKQMAESPNTGLRNDAFRNYADYMLTPDFQRAADDVIAMADTRRVAVMCAERMFFQCHRMLVSDYLSLHGHQVLHIVDTSPVKPHRITPEAKLLGGRVMYPGLF